MTIKDYFKSIESIVEESNLERHKFIKEIIKWVDAGDYRNPYNYKYMSIIISAIKRSDYMYGHPFTFRGSAEWSYNAVDLFLSNSIGVFTPNKTHSLEDCRKQYFYNFYNFSTNFIDRSNVMEEFKLNYDEICVTCAGQTYVYYVKKYRDN